MSVAVIEILLRRKIKSGKTHQHQTGYNYFGLKYSNKTASPVHRTYKEQFPLHYTCVKESGGECARRTPSLKLLEKLVW